MNPKLQSEVLYEPITAEFWGDISVILWQLVTELFLLEGETPSKKLIEKFECFDNSTFSFQMQPLREVFGDELDRECDIVFECTI